MLPERHRRARSVFFEPLEPRLLLSASNEGQEAILGPIPFEFSLDIASDHELSDPNLDGDEAFDPGDVYWSDSDPIDRPGRDGFKDDEAIFDKDPWPNPPDPEGETAVPVGDGSAEEYANYFDLDAHDEIDASLLEIGGEGDYIPRFPSQTIFPPKYLMVSYDDDRAPGWPDKDVPVAQPSPAGKTYGTTDGRDEIVGLTLDSAVAPAHVVHTYGVASEVEVHESLAPNPDRTEEDDDDVDSLDLVPHELREKLFRYFSADHEAHKGLDPASIYQVTGSGPVPVIRGAEDLGLEEGTDVDAFEFAWLDLWGKEKVLGVLFSVDENDRLTGADESGGLNPRMVYASPLDGTHAEMLAKALPDDVDALTLWREPLTEEDLDFGDAPDSPRMARYPTLLAHDGARHALGGPWLGDDRDGPDLDADGQPDPYAQGDDKLDGNDDEDGVSMPYMVQGTPTTIKVLVNGGGGAVQVWVDWNADGDWNDLGEYVFNKPLADGVHGIDVTPPIGAAVGLSLIHISEPTRPY